MSAAAEPTTYCPDDCDGPECDCPPRVGGACREHAWEHATGHLHAQCDRMRRGLFDAQRHVCPSPEWYGKVRQLIGDVAFVVGFSGPDLAALPAYIAALQLGKPDLAAVVAQGDSTAEASSPPPPPA